MISLVRRGVLTFIVALWGGFFGCAGFTSQEGIEEQVADSVITAQIRAALSADMQLRAPSLIKVETANGVILLSGFADSRLEVDEAVAVACSVRGGKRVKDDIVVRGRPEREP